MKSEIVLKSMLIDAFLESNAGKPVVAVQGLGFVGSVMSLVVANALTTEYAVIGVDQPGPVGESKINSINAGVFPVKAADPKIELFYQQARKKGNLLATSDPYAYSVADVIVIDINLDVQKQSGNQRELLGYDVDLSPFKKALQTIADHCKEDVLILIETTVPPGTSQHILQPIIKQGLEKRGLRTDRVRIGHSYERVMPGPNYIDSIQNFYRVYAGIDEQSADAVESFLRTIIKTDEYPLTRLGNTNATEMAKVLENSYRAMNIAFMVEWSRFAEEAGVDIYEVVNAIRMRPTHKNIMLPGLGVGGYCLTKDPLLASWARMNLFGSDQPLAQSETGVRINDRMPIFAFEYIDQAFKQSWKGKKVLLLGVSYLNDVGDTRYTPVEGFYDSLKAAGAELVLHDPHVPFWEERELAIESDLSKVLSDTYDLVVITTGHRDYRSNAELIEAICSKSAMWVYDTIGVFSAGEIKKMKQKHQVRVLGRGDLNS